MWVLIVALTLGATVKLELPNEAACLATLHEIMKAPESAKEVKEIRCEAKL